MKKTFIFVFALLFLLSLFPSISAQPGVPNWFYGEVIVNGEPAPDNDIIVASVGGDTYTTITTNGMYGISPSFVVEDPQNDRCSEEVCELVEFFVGGMSAGSIDFETNGYTRLDFSLETTCGDGYCLGVEESCQLCSIDCGSCTEPPQITIISPATQVYDAIEVSLDVSSNQPMLFWTYSLNNESLKPFTPPILITAEVGNNSLTVVGLNTVYQSASASVTFTVELPEVCGDGVCNGAESCSSCSADCGACPSSGGGSSGGGGGGGGSSSSSPTTNDTVIVLADETQDTLSQEETIEEEQEETNEEKTSEEEVQRETLLSKITGAFFMTNQATNFTFVIAIAFILVVFILFIVAIRKRKKSSLKKSDNN